MSSYTFQLARMVLTAATIRSQESGQRVAIYDTILTGLYAQPIIAIQIRNLPTQHPIYQVAFEVYDGDAHEVKGLPFQSLHLAQPLRDMTTFYSIPKEVRSNEGKWSRLHLFTIPENVNPAMVASLPYHLKVSRFMRLVLQEASEESLQWNFSPTNVAFATEVNRKTSQQVANCDLTSHYYSQCRTGLQIFPMFPAWGLFGALRILSLVPLPPDGLFLDGKNSSATEPLVTSLRLLSLPHTVDLRNFRNESLDSAHPNYPNLRTQDDITHHFPLHPRPGQVPALDVYVVDAIRRRRDQILLSRGILPYIIDSGDFFGTIVQTQRNSFAFLYLKQWGYDDMYRAKGKKPIYSTIAAAALLDFHPLTGKQGKVVTLAHSKFFTFGDMFEVTLLDPLLYSFPKKNYFPPDRLLHVFEEVDAEGNPLQIESTKEKKGKTKDDDKEEKTSEENQQGKKELRVSQTPITPKTLLNNILQWFFGVGESTNVMTVRIAILGLKKVHRIVDMMQPTNFRIEITYSSSKLKLSDFQKALEPASNTLPDVLILRPHSSRDLVTHALDARVVLVRSFLEKGGYLITAFSPATWEEEVEPFANLQSRCLLNHIIEIAGLAYITSGYKARPMSPGIVVPVAGENTCAEDTFIWKQKPSDDSIEPHFGHVLNAIESAFKAGQSHQVLFSRMLLTRLEIQLSKAPLTLLQKILTALTGLAPKRATSELLLDPDMRSQMAGVQKLITPTPLIRLPNNVLLYYLTRNPRYSFPNIQAHTAARQHKFNTDIHVASKEFAAVQAVKWLLIVLEGNILRNSFVKSCPVPEETKWFPGGIQTQPLTVHLPVRSPLRVHRFKIQIDLGLQGWQSTGLYVPPGHYNTIELLPNPHMPFDEFRPDMDVLIGSHSDFLEVAGKLLRWPDVQIQTRWFPNKKSFSNDDDEFMDSSISFMRWGRAIKVASPFGRLLYFQVNDNTLYHSQTLIDIAVTGPIIVPYYRLEEDLKETDTNRVLQHLTRYPFRNEFNDDHSRLPRDWRTQVSNFQAAPWGEIEGRFVIITLPYATLARITNVKGVVEFWDTVIQDQLQLAHQILTAKERIVLDVQLTLGYMHSGYPIMLQLDLCRPPDKYPTIPRIANLRHLRTAGEWGVFHELGHQRQMVSFTARVHVEVTVNLFALYTYFKVHSELEVEDVPWIHNNIPDYVRFLENPNSNFEDQRYRYGLAFAPYALFVYRFGFKALKRVFQAYANLRPEEIMNADVHILSLWVTQTSIAVKRDLRELYRLWKWPISETITSPCSAYAPERTQSWISDLRSLEKHIRKSPTVQKLILPNSETNHALQKK